MLRLHTFPLAVILPLVKAGAGPVLLNGIRVSVGVKRLVVFATKGIACKKCGLVGDHFALESHLDPATGVVLTPHLNLYGKCGEKEVLMTIDHIQALADGGTSEMSNLQPMCSPCNRRKGSIKGLARCARRGR